MRQMTLLLMVFAASAYAATEDLLTSDLTQFPKSGYQMYNRDGDTKRDYGAAEWEVDDVSNDAIFRSNSMPVAGEFDIELDKQDNLLLSPFIENTKQANFVKLSFKYNHIQICPTYTGIPAGTSVQCKNGFKYAVLKSADASTNHSQVDLDVESAERLNFKEITATSIGSDVLEAVEVELPAGTAGFRVAFWDQGSYFDIKSLKVQQLICSEKSFQHGFSICPETSTWMNGSRPVECSCEANKFVEEASPCSRIQNCERTELPGFEIKGTNFNPCKCIDGYTIEVVSITPPAFKCGLQTTTQSTATTTTTTAATPKSNSQDTIEVVSITPPAFKCGLQTTTQSTTTTTTTTTAATPKSNSQDTATRPSGVASTTNGAASQKDMVAVGVISASIIGVKFATFLTTLVQSIRRLC